MQQLLGRKRLQKDRKGYLLVCSSYGKGSNGRFTVEISANPRVPRVLIQDFTAKFDPLRFADEDVEMAREKADLFL